MSEPIPPTSASGQRLPGERLAWDAFKRRLFLTVGVAALLFILVNFVSATVDVLLLLFLCALIATGLRGISDWIAARTPLSGRVSLIVVLLVIVVLIIGAGLWIGPRIVQQFSALNVTVTSSLDRLEEYLSEFGWGQEFMQRLPSISDLTNQIVGQSSAIFTRITGIVSTVFNAVSLVIITIFTSIFFAIEPTTYTRNFLRVIPVEKRERVRETLTEVSETLRKWLMTRTISMIEVGILSTIGLFLLGIPLALSLGLLAGVGAFIPTFGPVLALIPTLLVALIYSPGAVLTVLALYLGIQMFDNYVVTPIMEKSMLYLPPGYIIAAQLILGVLAGAVGLALAAPLAAALVVVVRMLYVEDVLESDKQEAAEARSE